jgi:hypothetical protein
MMGHCSEIYKNETIKIKKKQDRIGDGKKIFSSDV